MVKKILIFLSILILGLFLCLTPSFVLPQGPVLLEASSDKNEGLGLEIYFFYSKTCPHCEEAKVFLEKLEGEYSDIKVDKLGVFEQENVELLRKLYQDYNVLVGEQGFVPITFFEERYFLGFSEEIGQDIENYIIEFIEETPLEPIQSEGTEKKIKIPIFGEIELSNFSPLLLAVLMGTLDGFNACAMVALGFLLAVLIATGVRKRIFLIGGVFILVSGAVYFLFISAWLNLFLCLAHLKFITAFVGIIIVLFSIFLLKDYFQGVICRVCQVQQGKEGILTKFEKKLFEMMEKVSSAQMSLPLALFGVAIVAAGVNMVELCCSFGFPLVFTKILTSWHLSTGSYYFYLLIYILFYMLDDFLIFTLAVLTLKMTQASQKYLKAIKLISGILLLLLGLIMLIKPEILMFG